MSRLDRLYLTDNIANYAWDWKTRPSGIPGTDHLMVLVQIAHREAPAVGKGRWTLKNHVLWDKKFRAFVIAEGNKALEEIERISNHWSPDHNAQTVYQDWKDSILTFAVNRDKELVPKYIAKKKLLEADLASVINSQNLEE